MYKIVCWQEPLDTSTENDASKKWVMAAGFWDRSGAEHTIAHWVERYRPTALYDDDRARWRFEVEDFIYSVAIEHEPV